jgi:hypothetical protein
MTTVGSTPVAMSIRFAYAILAAGILTGCASPTEPMACQDNPRCKADAQPVPTTTLLLDQAAPAPIVDRNRPNKLSK